MFNIGVKTYDIRDFFDESFVKEYKEVVIEYRNLLDKELPTTKNDGNTTKSLDLIKWIEERTNKDFSYLYEPVWIYDGQKEYRYDYKFVKAAYEYLNSINIDENWQLGKRSSKDIVPNLSSLNLMYTIPVIKTPEYYLMTDKINEVILQNVMEEFPYTVNSLDDIQWKLFEDEEYSLTLDNPQVKKIQRKLMRDGYLNPRLSGHMIAMPKGAFMDIHTDDAHERPFTLLNYVNVDRTIEDGGLYRYYIHKDYDVEDKESLDWSRYPDYHPSETRDISKTTHNQHDIVPNYTKVNVMFHLNYKTKEEDKKYFLFETPLRTGWAGSQGVPHLVTKNKSDEVRYTIYHRIVWKDS